MKVVSLKSEEPKGNGTFKAEFSDGSLVLFSCEYLPEWILFDFEDGGVLAGTDLSQAEEEAFRFAALCFSVESIALRLIARAEQNSVVLASKLERRGCDYAAVRAVISALSGRGLLNDERFSELWIRSRLSGGKAVSPRWLLASLGRRGVSRGSSIAAIEKVVDPETEYEILLNYVKKTNFPDTKTGWSLRRWLKAEGFSYDVLERYFDN